MDIAELRAAFVNSGSLETRVRQFREQRIKRIESGCVPKPLIDGMRICLHMIPIESMFGERRIDLNSYHDLMSSFRPMGNTSGFNVSVNLDGAIAYASSENSYVQLFRAGQLEAVFVYPHIPHYPGALWTEFEKHVRAAATDYLGELRRLDFAGPVSIMLTILNAKGGYLHVNEMSMYGSSKIELDTIPTPDVLVHDESQLHGRLTELIDIIWHAYGKVRPKDFKPA
jgi:hypothetical protein